MIGVAEATVSAAVLADHAAKPPGKPEKGSGHSIVIWVGKAMYTKQRPASAGLKMLRPNPPKAILANTIANSMPITAIHIGVRGGRVSVYSAAVTNTASLTLALSLLIDRMTRYSAAAPHRATASAITTCRQPKK